MAVSDVYARAIVQGMQEQMERNKFADTTIVVGDTTFECHRFLLSACSDFFRAAFSSGMKEDLRRQIEIKGISPDTFSLILESLYKGRYVLDSENAAQLWHAANQLQIGFLIESCEQFQAKHLSKDTCIEIYINAKVLDSKKLKNLSLDVTVKEFNHCIKCDDMLLLDFGDIKRLVTDDNLEVESEDTVIDMILRWVDFNPEETMEKESQENAFLGHTQASESGSPEDNDEEDDPDTSDAETEVDVAHGQVSADQPNKRWIKTLSRQVGEDRRKFLPELLAVAKICHVSGPCIQRLMTNKMILEAPEALSIVQEGLRYQLQPGRRHDYCPPSAVHKKTSPLQNVTLAITGQAQQVNLSCRTTDGIWYRLATPPIALPNFKAVVYEDDIFAACVSDAQQGGGFVYKYTTETNAWRQKKKKPQPRANFALACLDDFIYAVGGDNCTDIERFCVKAEQRVPNSGTWEKVGSLEHAMSNLTVATFGSNLIVCGTTNNNMNSTAIQCFDTLTMSTHYYPEGLSGSAKNMVTFRYKESPFLLQESGALWKIATCTKTKPEFHFQKMLWDFDVVLKAAVIHNEELLVLVSKIASGMPFTWDITGNDMFKRLRIIERDGNFLLNTVIKKTFLTTKEA